MNHVKKAFPFVTSLLTGITHADKIHHRQRPLNCRCRCERWHAPRTESSGPEPISVASMMQRHQLEKPLHLSRFGVAQPPFRTLTRMSLDATDDDDMGADLDCDFGSVRTASRWNFSWNEPKETARAPH